MKLSIKITVNDQGSGFLDIRIPTSKDVEIVVQQRLTLHEVLEATYGFKNVLTPENKSLLMRHMF